jgi:hypothetical protein
MRRILVLLALVSAVHAPAAGASQVISTSTVTGLTLGVNSKGEALLAHTSKGKVVHVLAWGATNAIAPARGVDQVAFELDYSGGFDKYYNQDPSIQKLRIEFGVPAGSGTKYRATILGPGVTPDVTWEGTPPAPTTRTRTRPRTSRSRICTTTSAGRTENFI